MEATSIEDSWGRLKQLIQEAIYKRIPTKMTSTRYTNPWMNTTIKRLIKRKQMALRTAKKSKLKRNTDRYKRLQKEVQYQVRKASKEYLMGTVSNDYRDNTKKFWSYVKSRGQETTGVSPLKNKDGFLQSGNIARANILNDQFVSVFTKENTTNIPNMGHSTTPSMPDIIIDWKGVHKLLMNLKTNKATGPDEIPAFILKEAATQVAPALARLFQLSLNIGQVPNDWKEASVVPLFKKGDRHQASNYRPVSLTSIACKLLEHIIHGNIMQHFDQHSILKDNQHGFRKRRSCETQLITTLHEIASSTARGKQVDVVLLDFAKAFDKVPHSRLLLKLDHYGVRGNVKEWIRQFLSNRTQQVVLEGISSTSAKVLSGVPQGTVLGPLLFLAFINDLPDVIESSSSKLFADDSAVFKAIESDQDRQLLQKKTSMLWKNGKILGR